VFQRPQHLMSRFARNRRVFYFEEPVVEDSVPLHVRSRVCPESGVHVETPVLPSGLSPNQIDALQRELLDSVLEKNGVSEYIAWYYTPMAMQFTGGLDPKLTIYDCMDELSAFAGASPLMKSNEQALFRAADLVLTGGASLFGSKRKQHKSVHLFPSSVDVPHFARAREHADQPQDQANIPEPRLGYAGVIDERMDVDLLRETAAARPEWQFVFVGPVVKIDPASLPKAKNIHFLGMKSYAELPAYLSGWKVGMLPFALNESTRYISPTKTPEYLAAGLRVISTPIRDVVDPYGDLELVTIASSPNEFVERAERILAEPVRPEFRERVDQFLAKSSWDKTLLEMERLIEDGILRKRFSKEEEPVTLGTDDLTVEGRR
jgi:glycosyltransferase involved in cell wall biosynthesis